MNQERIEAAAKGIESEIHTRDFRDMAVAALTAADAVMFSDESIERAAEALCMSIGKVEGLWWMHSENTKNTYRTHARAALEAAEPTFADRMAAKSIHALTQQGKES